MLFYNYQQLDAIKGDTSLMQYYVFWRYLSSDTLGIFLNKLLNHYNLSNIENTSAVKTALEKLICRLYFNNEVSELLTGC